MPEPRPTSLVEKKGSNMRSSVSAAMPLPLSATLSSTQLAGGSCARQEAQVKAPPDSRSRTLISPDPSMASRALMHRLNSTCSSCTASASTQGLGIVGRQHRIHRHRGRQRRAQQLQRLAHQRRQRQHAALATLAPREGQHLRDQLARALRRQMRLVELALQPLVAERPARSWPSTR